MNNPAPSILATNDRGATGKLDPDPSFLAALAVAEEKATALREALDGVVRLSPAGNVPLWTVTMVTPEAAERFGALLLLCNGASAQAAAFAQETLAALQQVAKRPIVEEFALGLANGQLRAAMSCKCGYCEVCQTKAEIGEEEAERRIGAELRGHVQVKPASGLVGLNGKPLRKG